MFDKLLICNRGEIAVRIVKACRELGITSVVAHSSADAGSMSIALADESFCLGPGPAARSYLNIPAILYACARTGAQAVHPGYGFLAEDATFAAVCAEAGVTFVGPHPDVLTLMGDKCAARAAMTAAGVPIPPGSVTPLRDAMSAVDEANRIGYPVVLKAVAGGGGRGLAVVTDRGALTAAFAEVQAFARKTFLDDRIGIERFIPTARHVEVQLLGDGAGSLVHLGERDCTVQRRHQKLVEETPSSTLPPGVAERLYAAALAGGRAAALDSAGTMEFLVDDDQELYFLEMNPRIQVEHTVTEARTGIDLVQWMIRIAAGERLTFGQADVEFRGHAIECRINADDVARGWAGQPGTTISHLRIPSGAGIRVDCHIHPGHVIPPFYDSLLAKIITTGADRAEAIGRMQQALAQFECEGPVTTRDFHLALMRHPVFRCGDHRLDLLERHLSPDGILLAAPYGSTGAP